ncbi:MAG: hypothetical protein COB85_06840 [Bacteroidetes bacterium]|nr:MAG: hypothetical protein COB85_06840 [Bacteroidota bacterium]
MDILGKGKYGCLGDFEWKDIPELSIITGLNGSGKTQFLRVLHQSIANRERGVSHVEEPKSNIRDTNNKIEIVLNDVPYKTEEILYWTSLGALRNSITFGSTDFHMFAEKLLQYTTEPKTENRNQTIAGVKYNSEAIIVKLERITGKSRDELTLKDIHDNFNSDILVSDNTFTNFELAVIFYNYHFNLKKAEIENASQEEIEKLGPPPWDTLNFIFDILKLPYKANNPSDINILDATHHGTTFNLHLVEKNTGAIIDFNELSSGENMLMSLAFLQYKSDEYKSFPKLMILDEPDAHLHPSMTSQFFDVVYKILVQKHKVKVIMTTHDPNTVALAPTDLPGCQIFEMTKQPTEIKPIASKSKMIALLTDGLTIVTPATKYIFVEDEDDVTFYTEVYNVLISEEQLDKSIPLVFVPASNRKADTPGGKDAVKTWTDRFVRFSDVIQGLIDKDSGATPSDGVHVLSRYSIENYLVDPIVIYGALINHPSKKPEIPGIDLGVAEEHKIKELEENDLQTIADTIINNCKDKVTNYLEGAVKGKNPSYDTAQVDAAVQELYTLETVEFINGKKLKYPKWLIESRGKSLKVAFNDSINAPRTITYGPLIMSLKRTGMVPKDLKELLEGIQKSWQTD